LSISRLNKKKVCDLLNREPLAQAFVVLSLMFPCVGCFPSSHPTLVAVTICCLFLLCRQFCIVRKLQPTSGAPPSVDSVLHLQTKLALVVLGDQSLGTRKRVLRAPPNSLAFANARSTVRNKCMSRISVAHRSVVIIIKSVKGYSCDLRRENSFKSGHRDEGSPG
jgi:hypothetical protein